ncbi:MAG: ribonuclease III [Myxococcota bacterium]
MVRRVPQKNDDDRVTRVEEILGHRFRDRTLALCALTHRSHVHEDRAGAGVGHNERLEFLGDAVLGLVAAETLLAMSPRADEGELTRRRAAFVSEQPLAAAAEAKGLGPLLRMGRGQTQEGGERLASLLADAVEALIAAVFLDAGLGAARGVVVRLLGDPPTHDVAPVVDPKSRLQELLQAQRGVVPRYDVVRIGGKEHEPRYEAQVWCAETLLGRGEGLSKKLATRAAASAALEHTGLLVGQGSPE